MSDNLDLGQVATNQNQKEVTINTQAGRLDAAITESTSVNFTSSDVTLTNDQFRRNFGFVSQNVNTARTLEIPSIKHLFFVSNADGSATLSVTRGTTQVDVDAGAEKLCYSDGTTNGLIELANSAAGQTGPYDIGGFFPGTQGDGQLIMRFVFPRSVSLPATAVGSRGFLGTAPASQTDYVVQKNGSTLGTMRFASSDATASFVSFTGTSFAAGERLSLVSPATADTVAADLSFTFNGTRD